MKRLFIILFLLCLPVFAQQHEIRRPVFQSDDQTAAGTTVCIPPAPGEYDPGSGLYLGQVDFYGFDLVPNFYDLGGVATSSTASVDAKYSAAATGIAIFYNFPAPSGAYTSATLNVQSACAHVGLNGQSNCGMEYSLDNLTWVKLRKSISWDSLLDSVPLPEGQDITQIRFRACIWSSAYSKSTVTGSFTGFDLWVDGVLPGGVGGGPGPGQRKKIVVTK